MNDADLRTNRQAEIEKSCRQNEKEEKKGKVSLVNDQPPSSILAYT